MEALAPIFSFLAAAGPAIGGVATGVGALENLFGGGGQGGPGSAAPKPPTQPAIYAGGALAPPTTSPTDYKANENAYWQQLFAGTGQGLPGGSLPPGIQENIDKQASLLG